MDTFTKPKRPEILSSRLCYVDGCFAYFTTLAAEEQEGENWDKDISLYTAREPERRCWHNNPAEIEKRGSVCQCPVCVRDWNPDGSPKWSIYKVAFEDWRFESAIDFGRGYTIFQVNKKAVPWLRTVDRNVFIYGGDTLPSVLEKMARAGSEVYLRPVDAEELRRPTVRQAIVCTPDKAGKTASLVADAVDRALAVANVTGKKVEIEVITK